jgi:hypothetical protein|tara:strand:- start:104 stop:484 length:381 start_codon:yes stop_codon:yes gene_type:complete
MQFRTLLKIYYKKIFFWMFLSTVFAFSIYYGIDKKFIVFIAFVISVFTEVFVGLSAFIAAIPIIGPMIIKIVTIPVFWIFNAMGTLVSGLAIKKGYATEFAKGRILTLALLIGIIIGYILGNLIPL